MSLESYTNNMTIHYRIVKQPYEAYSTSRSYDISDRVEDPYKNCSTAQYLQDMDNLLDKAHASLADGAANDLVSLVFANQAATHELSSRQLAELIRERRVMAGRHLEDIKFRLEEMQSAKPIRLPHAANAHQIAQRWNQVQKQIADLERQKHDLQLSLWRDTLELRTKLLEERREYQATQRRQGFLTGEQYGGV